MRSGSLSWVAAVLLLAAAAPHTHTASAAPWDGLTSLVAHDASATSLALSDPATNPFPCSWTSPKTSSSPAMQFDFSGLATPSGTLFVGTEGLSDKFFINFCGLALGDGVGGTCEAKSATLCLRYTYVLTNVWWAIALNLDTPTATPPTYGLVTADTPANGVSLTFKNGVYNSAGAVATVVYNFICSETEPGPTYSVQHDTASAVWIVNFTSTLCCGKKISSKKGGISGGWVFIIIVLIFTVVYVAGGCAYKHYRIGTQGRESCPNIDMWREFPGLVKDGIIFFIAFCRAKCGGGGGGGGSRTYEDLK